MGIESFDRVRSRPSKGERETLSSHIAPDEKVIDVHLGASKLVLYPSEVLGEFPQAVITDKRLILMVPPKGLFGRQWTVYPFGYEQMKPGIAKNVSAPGATFDVHTAAFGLRNGQLYGLEYWGKQGQQVMELFATSLQGELSSFRFLVMGVDPVHD
jgi:hypothetical protein